MSALSPRCRWQGSPRPRTARSSPAPGQLALPSAEGAYEAAGAAMATDGKPAGTFRAAAVQDGSVWLDRVASTAKACELIAEAGRGGADIVALPESFIPGFPYWLFTAPLMEGAAFHRRLHDEAVEIPGPTITALGEAAAEAGVTAVVGITERDPGRIGTLYNTTSCSARTGRCSASTASSCRRGPSARCGRAATARRCPSSTPRTARWAP